jgi:hypothetical protein
MSLSSIMNTYRFRLSSLLKSQIIEIVLTKPKISFRYVHEYIFAGAYTRSLHTMAKP